MRVALLLLLLLYFLVLKFLFGFNKIQNCTLIKANSTVYKLYLNKLYFFFFLFFHLFLLVGG